MEDLRFDTRMSDTEALVWALEEHDARLRSTIVVVAFLDRSPGIDAVRTRFDRVSRLLPRFRDRVVPPTASFSAPRWEPEPSFDLGFHVRNVQLRSGGGPAGVLRWAEPIAAEGLDRSRPLWQVTLVEGWPDDTAALVLKLHHTFTDGLGAVKLAALLFDFAPDAPEPELPPLVQLGAPHALAGLLGDVGTELRHGLDVARATLPVLAGSVRALGDPRPRAAATADLVGSIARLAAPTVRPLSPILRTRTMRGRFEMLEAPLAGVQAVARDAGGTVNDVFVSALMAGLRRYHERHGSWPDALRVGLPISTRRPDTDGSMRNQFAPVRLTVPLQESDPVARLSVIHRLVAVARRESGLDVVDQLAGVVNRIPGVRALLAATMASVDVVASNVPGVDVPLYLRGARVVRLVPFGPRNGAALNATVVSYDGTLHLGLNLDAVAVPDADVLIESMRAGLAETIGA